MKNLTNWVDWPVRVFRKTLSDQSFGSYLSWQLKDKLADTTTTFILNNLEFPIRYLTLKNI